MEEVEENRQNLSIDRVVRGKKNKSIREEK
jgi:hypothetical protein